MTDKQEDEFPKKGSSHSGTMSAYTAELSPALDMNAPHTSTTLGIRQSPWLKGHWYPIPIADCPSTYGVSSLKTEDGHELKGFFSRAGAEALRWSFLAHNGTGISLLNFKTRIIEHRIASTYEETAVGVIAELDGKHKLESNLE